MSKFRRVPVVKQCGLTDCGAACLAMVLRFHGKRVTRGHLVRELESSLAGVTAKAIVVVAGRYGLCARGVHVSKEQIPILPVPAILHWNTCHFVVLEDAFPKRFRIVDPLFGRRVISRALLKRSFAGMALIFQDQRNGCLSHQ